MQNKTYAGIDEDDFGGMTDIGAIIKDGWLFSLIAETETGKGWNPSLIQVLYDKAQREWNRYGCLASNLPPELRERHQRIHSAAIERAKAQGWDPEA